MRAQIEIHGGEEGTRLHHSVPMKWIGHVRIRGNSERSRTLIVESFQSCQSAAMLMIAHPPARRDAQEREDRGESASRRGLRVLIVCPTLPFDQRNQYRHSQPQSERHQKNWFHDKNDVPRIPALIKRPERTHSIIVGEVEQNVTEAGETG